MLVWSILKESEKYLRKAFVTDEGVGFCYDILLKQK